MTISFPCHNIPILNSSISSAQNAGTFQSETNPAIIVIDPNKEHRLDRFTRNFITVRTGSFVPAKGKEKQLLKIIDLYLLNLEV